MKELYITLNTLGREYDVKKKKILLKVPLLFFLQKDYYLVVANAY